MNRPQRDHAGDARDMGQPDGGRAEEGTPGGTAEYTEHGNDFESRFTALAHERDIMLRDGEITFQIAHLQAEGLQTLIDGFGTDAVFEAIKKQFEAHAGSATCSTFEVVKALEQDPERRQALFDKMQEDAQSHEEHEELADRQPGQEEIHSRYFRSMWGNARNYSRIVSHKTNAMRALNRVFGRIVPQRHYKILGSRMNEFATYISQFEEEEQKVKQQLAKSGNNIFRLAESRNQDGKQQTVQLRDRADQLRSELTDEVERITQELNASLEEWRADVIHDISKVGTLDATSKEVQSAVQGLLEKVERDIADRVSATEREIAKKIAPLQKLIGRVEDLHRSR